MFVYFALALLVPVSYWVFRKKENCSDIVLAIACSAMLLLLCLRNPFGFLDLPSYYQYFEKTRGFSFSEMVKGTRFLHVHSLIGEESGYIWLNWLLSHMGASFNILLCLHAVLVCAGIFIFVRKYSTDPVFSIYFFLCIGGLTDHTYILRQSFAFVILLFALPYAIDRKLFRFLLLVALASLFHRTALSFLLIYPLSYVKVTRKTALAGIAISLSMVLIVPLLYSSIISNLMAIMGKTGYKIGEPDFKEMIVVLVAMLCFAVYVNDFSKEMPRSDTAMFWLSMMALFFLAISVHIYIMARVGMSMYLPFAMIMLPNFMARNGNSVLMGRFKMLISLALFAYLIFIVLTTPYSFSFVWEAAGSGGDAAAAGVAGLDAAAGMGGGAMGSSAVLCGSLQSLALG